MSFIVTIVTLLTSYSSGETSNGYLAYCPCMGRFGNQADHFLGALAFSKSLNRTLILPPWIEYRYGERNSIQIPFDTYFKVEPLKEYHSVVTMESFMKDADHIWPAEERTAFCFAKRHGEENASCNAKSGNPFGPFWDTYKINFTSSEFYGPLNYDAQNENMVRKWKEKYPPNAWPVLAFTGAPASFPVQKENIHLQKYLKWSNNITKQAKAFIKKHMGGGAFIGIHLRNGQDWVKACQHIKDSPTLFASPQCVGYKNEYGHLTMEMCLPDKSDIIRQIKRSSKKVDNVTYVYVASDANHLLEDLNQALHSVKIKAVKLVPSNPHLDLAILGLSNHFIGNCVSSFSAFVKRERDYRGFPSEFWGFPPKKRVKHEEL